MGGAVAMTQLPILSISPAEDLKNKNTQINVSVSHYKENNRQSLLDDATQPFYDWVLAGAEAQKLLIVPMVFWFVDIFLL